MKNLFFILSLLLPFAIFSSSAFPQSNLSDSLKIDSLKKLLQTQKDDTNKVNTLNHLSVSFLTNGNYENAMRFAKQALSLSERIDFQKGKGTTYTYIGLIYTSRGNFTEAFKNCFIALKIMKEIGDKAGISACYDIIVLTYQVQQNYPEAIKYSYFKLAIDEETGDKIGMGEMLYKIGTFYSSLHDNAEALKNYMASFKIYEKIDEEETVFPAIGLGDTYFNLGNYAEALKYDSLALKICQKPGNSKWGEGWIYRNIGKVYAKLGEMVFIKGDKTTAANKFDEAEKNYLTYLKISNANKDTVSIADAYLNLGKLYIKLNNPLIAKNYLEKSLQLYKTGGSHTAEGISDNYNALSTLDSIQGNYKQAYAHYRLYILYRDSLANAENARKFSQSAMQYEFDKKEVLNKAEQDKKDEAARRTRNLQYFAIGAFLLIAVFLYIYSRQKQKAKSKIEKAYTELKAAQAQLIHSEKMASLGELTAGIAHEIQNPLNFVNNFSEVNGELISELVDEVGKGNYDEVKVIAVTLKDNEEKIIQHGKRADAIVKGMLQHSKTSTGVKELTDINKLADEYSRLSYHGMRAKDKSFEVKIITDFDESIGKVNVVSQDIGRVLLNLFNNAFYAVNERRKIVDDSYQPTVSVVTKKINDKIEIKVVDNGNGISQNIIVKIFQPFFTTKPTGQGTGLGLSLAYDIITKEHNGTVKVESREGEETVFIIHLPVT